MIIHLPKKQLGPKQQHVPPAAVCAHRRTFCQKRPYALALWEKVFPFFFGFFLYAKIKRVMLKHTDIADKMFAYGPCSIKLEGAMAKVVMQERG